MIVALCVVGWLAGVALALAFVGRGRRREIKALEAEALDQTVRWAYNEGYRARGRADDLDDGLVLVVADFHLRWGERREVRS